MGERTKISWSDATQNFWIGCKKKSPGCAACYAERFAKRYGRDFNQVTRTSPRTFQAPLRWQEPKIIFTCSLSDFFIRDADKWRADAHAIMERTPQHTYLILTKEIDRAVKLKYVPPKNAILGVSAENQYWLDKRTEYLFRVPATGYFISAEPLLGPLQFPLPSQGSVFWSRMRCVITGGESGGTESRSLVVPVTSNHVWNRGRVSWLPKASAVEWVRQIRGQCEAAGVTFFHKQWGGPRPESGGCMVGGKKYQDMGWAKLMAARH